MSSYSRPVPAHLKGPRGNQPNAKQRAAFSSTAAQPHSAHSLSRDKPARPAAARPTHHPHALTVDVSHYTHSQTQPLSPISPPSGDAKHSPQPRPYTGYGASQYGYAPPPPAAPAHQPYPAAYPQYMNDVSPHPTYAPPPPPQYAMSPYNTHMAYPPRPSHAPPPATTYTPHSPVFYPRHPPAAGPPPQHFHPPQPPFHAGYTMYPPPPPNGAAGARGHTHAQSMQLSQHAPVVDSAKVVSLSLFDDKDGPQQQAAMAAPLSAPHASRVRVVEEEQTADALHSDAAQAELRATCQQFILSILTNRQNSTATPPWREHGDKHNHIVVEYEALYSQMISLSPSLATAAPPTAATEASSGRLSASSPATRPASSRLSVELTPRMSKERRPSRLSIISSALRARLGSKDSADGTHHAVLPSQPEDGGAAGGGGGDGSVVASPRHSFSLLMPSFSTLHAVTKVMQLTKRVRKGIAAKKDVADDKAEQAKEAKRKAGEADDEDNSTPPAQSSVEDDKQHAHLMIDALQSHSTTAPSSHYSATQPLPSSATPLSPTSAASATSPSSRSPRVFKSRFKKQQELSQMQQPNTESDSGLALDQADTPVVRKPVVGAFSYTMPLPRAALTADKGEQQAEEQKEVEEQKSVTHDEAKSSRAAAVSHPKPPAPSDDDRAKPTAARPAHRRNVTFATGPAKDKTHLRSLSTLPPLPPLPPSLTARTSTATAPTAAHTAPTSPAPRTTATPTKPATPIAAPFKAKVTHHKHVTARLARPLLVRSDAVRALYGEKLEAAEHADKSARQRKAADEKRRARREQLMERPVKKWGRRGWPHKSRLHVSQDGRLHWNWKGDDKAAVQGEAGKSVALKGVRAVVPGLNPAEHKGVAFATSVLCFSVLGEDRVLECECASVRERDDWMEELRVDVGEAKTRGCVWTGRVLMSIERDTSIECVVAEEDKGISFI